MKKNVFTASLLILTLIFISVGCKKQPFDYRNKYIGKFNFVYSYRSWTMQGTYASDTIYYSGKIYYDISSEDKIKLDYDQNATLELDINKNGELSLPCGVTIGKFDNNDQVTLNYGSNSCSGGGGGLGGGTNCSLTGTRK